MCRHAAHVTITIAALFAATFASPATAAEAFFATTPGNVLVSFTSQAPGRITASEPLNGLGAGEAIVGLDQRPATGQLYALTSAGRILVVNPISGDTKAVGAPLGLSGTRFGFDVDPQTDTLRVVSDADQNLRVDPDDGSLVATDGVLAYRTGDSGAGTNPNVGAAAFTLGVFGGAAPGSTTQYDVDSGRDVLVKQDPANVGTLVTVGALGVDAEDRVHLDVSGAQVTYAAFSAAGRSGMRLWTIDTTTGTASEAADDAVIGIDEVTALAAFGGVVDDTRGPAVAIGNYTVYRRIWLDRGLNFTLSCPEDCTSQVTLRLRNTVLGSQTVSMRAAGTRVARIELTELGRTAAAATGRVPATLTFRTVDAAGNVRNQVTSFVSVR